MTHTVSLSVNGPRSNSVIYRTLQVRNSPTQLVLSSPLTSFPVISVDAPRWSGLLAQDSALVLEFNITPAGIAPWHELPLDILARCNRFSCLGDVRGLEVLSSYMRNRLHTDAWDLTPPGTQEFHPALEATRARVASLFSKYFPRRERDFRTALRTTRAVITGVEPLLTLQDAHTIRWQTLEIRVGFDDSLPIRSLLQGCGYLGDSAPDFDGFEFVHPGRGHRVNVKHVTRSHDGWWGQGELTTSRLNWIDADAIYCAFPALTFARMYACSSPMFRHESGGDALLVYREHCYLQQRKQHGEGGWMDWHGRDGEDFPALIARAWSTVY